MSGINKLETRAHFTCGDYCLAAIHCHQLERQQVYWHDSVVTDLLGAQKLRTMSLTLYSRISIIFLRRFH